MDKMKDSGIKWIGKIPKNWKVLPIKSGFLYQKLVAGDSHEKYPRLTLAKAGVLERPKYDGNGQSPANYSTYQIVPEGEFIFNLMGLEQDSDYRRVGIPPKDGLLSSGYVRLDHNPNVVFNRFALYYFLDLEARRIFNSYGTGIRSTLNGSQLVKIPMIFPPISEQQRIAKFLDEKIALIDGIITDTKQTIEELKSYKQSLISEIVTKGLDSSETLVPSGVEWIGDSPKGWNKFTIGQLFEQVRQKNTRMIETNLLSLSYGRIKKRDINSGEGLLPESFEGYNIIEKNDIVLRMTDLQNDKKSLRQGISEERGIITSAYITIRAFQKVCSRFVYYQLFGFDVNKGYYGMGSGVRQGVNWNDVKKLPLMLPSFELQNQIADFLDRKTAQIDTLITEKENVISEYENYKKSLIYEYVTGKKQVEGYES
jgi:hypothetical protein